MTETAKLSHQLIELYERLSSWEQDVVKNSGLSTHQMHTIEIVGHSGSLRMKDLAQKMGVTTGTLTVMVDRLEQQDILHRQAHETDRRCCGRAARCICKAWSRRSWKPGPT